MTSLAAIDPPLFAILRGVTVAEAPVVGKELVAAGIRVLEVTMNSPDPLTSIQALAQAHGEETLVGAGTVLRPEEVDAVAEANGKLIVSPNFDPAVVRRAKELGLFAVPGCLTPTEAFAAHAAGADMIKVFPGEMATPAVIKALRAVLPKQALLAVTGGVNLDNIAQYKAAGANAMGLGSALYKPGKNPADVRRDAEAFVAAYHG